MFEVWITQLANFHILGIGSGHKQGCSHFTTVLKIFKLKLLKYYILQITPFKWRKTTYNLQGGRQKMHSKQGNQWCHSVAIILWKQHLLNNDNGKFKLMDVCQQKVVLASLKSENMSLMCLTACLWCTHVAKKFSYGTNKGQNTTGVILMVNKSHA